MTRHETQIELPLDGKKYTVTIFATGELDLKFLEKRKDEIRPFIEKKIKYGYKEISLDEVLAEFAEEDKLEKNTFETEVDRADIR